MRYLIAFVIFLLMTACSRADEIATVVLKNDSSYTGKVVVNLATEIALRLPDGTLKSFRRTVIREIIIHQDVSNASIVRTDTSATADTSRVNQPITTYSYLKPDSVNADPPDFFCLGAT